MTAPTHTPGPWKVQPSFSIKAQEVGTVVYGNPDNPNRGHDAALIAAAPDLYAALQRQRENIERWLETGEPASSEESKSIYEQICAALAKATGGEQ